MPASGSLLASGRTEEVIPLVEEIVHLGKRTAETGRVRVSLTTETVEETLRETCAAGVPRSSACPSVVR